MIFFLVECTLLSSLEVSPHEVISRTSKFSREGGNSETYATNNGCSLVCGGVL